MKRTYEGIFVKVVNVAKGDMKHLTTIVYPNQGLTPDFARTITGDFAIGLENSVYICTLELDLEKSDFYTVIFKQFHPNLPTKEDLEANYARYGEEDRKHVLVGSKRQQDQDDWNATKSPEVLKFEKYCSDILNQKPSPIFIPESEWKDRKRVMLEKLKVLQDANYPSKEIATSLDFYKYIKPALTQGNLWDANSLIATEENMDLIMKDFEKL